MAIQVIQKYVDTIYEKDQMTPMKGLIVFCAENGKVYIGNGEAFSPPPEPETNIIAEVTIADFTTEIPGFTITAVSDYTVDWGDAGTTESYASGVMASHTYASNATFPITVESVGATKIDFKTGPTAVTDRSFYTGRLTIEGADLETLALGDRNTSFGVMSGITEFDFINGDDAMLNSGLRILSYFTGLTTIYGFPRFSDSVYSLDECFRFCTSLAAIPTNFDPVNARSARLLFDNCSVLTSCPDLHFGNLTGAIDGLFRQNIALVNPPVVDFTGSTDTGTQQMFAECSSIVNAANIVLSPTHVNFTFSWRNCTSLETVPPIDVSDVTTSLDSTFANCPALLVGRLEGTKVSISYASCVLLDDAARLDIIDGLADLTGQTAQTVTFDPLSVTSATMKNNALAKNWLVSPVNPLFLDEYPALLGFDFVERSTAMAGVDLVEIRRDLDEAVLDFTAAEITDGTLVAWTGAGSGFITKWYNQGTAGSGVMFVQATPANQLVIVDTGVLQDTTGFVGGLSALNKHMTLSGTIDLTGINTLHSQCVFDNSLGPNTTTVTYEGISTMFDNFDHPEGNRSLISGTPSMQQDNTSVDGRKVMSAHGTKGDTSFLTLQNAEENPTYVNDPGTVDWTDTGETWTIGRGNLSEGLVGWMHAMFLFTEDTEVSDFESIATEITSQYGI